MILDDLIPINPTMRTHKHFQRLERLLKSLSTHKTENTCCRQNLIDIILGQQSSGNNKLKLEMNCYMFDIHIDCCFIADRRWEGGILFYCDDLLEMGPLNMICSGVQIFLYGVWPPVYYVWQACSLERGPMSEIPNVRQGMLAINANHHHKNNYIQCIFSSKGSAQNHQELGVGGGSLIFRVGTDQFWQF